MLNEIAELARLAMTREPGTAEVEEACACVRAALEAEDAYIIRSGDPHFTRLGAAGDPTQYEIKQKGYWHIWQRLATRPDVDAGMFRVEDRIVQPGQPLAPREPVTHIAAILPGDESNSELLIVRGPWPAGLTPDQVEFTVAARPVLSFLTANVLDSERRARQQQQLSALADVSKAFSEAQEMDKVLAAVATAMAKAAGFDWAAITLYNDELDAVTDRAMNIARHSETETAAMAREGRLNADSSDEVSADTGVFLRDLVSWGRPLLIPDVMASEVDERPELESYRPLFPALRKYYERAHVVSTATFPVLFQGDALGSVQFSSSTKHSFEQHEVELLTAVVAQAATAIKGLRLYRDLERSQEELRRYADQLEQASRIEHHLARTDALTGLPNRRYIEETLEAECARARRYGQAFGVAMADIDRFKDINDSFGHATGDDALRFVATLARQSCRTADFVGRWGGDEFLFILPATPITAVHEFADRFRTGLAAAQFIHPNVAGSVRMTISLGVAECGPEGLFDPALLVERADKALYEAKDGGRNLTVRAREPAARI